MATNTTEGTTSVCIMSQQDTEDVLKEYEDAFEIYVTTIPRDGSLTKEEFSKRYKDLEKEFQEKLVEVANKASNLNVLVTFINSIANETHSSEICSVEQDSETEENKSFHQNDEINKATIVVESVLYSRTSPDITHTIEEYNEAVKVACKENKQYNSLILENYFEWLNVPFLAVERNNIELIQMCIETGVDLETFRNCKGQTLLGHAVEQSIPSYDIVNILLKCIGVNIGAKDDETLAMTCLQNKTISVQERFALLERLIDTGADVMTRSFHFGTTLHVFISSLALEMDVTKLAEWKSVIDLLLTKGVDINAIDFFGQTALMCAIINVPPTGIEDSDVYDKEQRSIIIDARRYKIDIVEYLLQKGASLEVVGKNGYTALCIALTNQNIDVVHTLVKHGANVNHLTHTKMSPAYVICCDADWSDEIDIETILFPSLRILLNAGLDINIKGIDDSTVLHFVAAALNPSICEFLLKSGADIEARDYLQRKPLHMAVMNKNIVLMETLIKLGADIEAKDIHGDTPLTHACLHGNTNAVQILIENGADYKTCGDLGIQPIHIAAENGDSLMMKIFQNKGCDLSSPDASGSTPLHYAASDGNPDTVQYLLSQNVNKNCKDYHGQVPLDLALLRGQYRVSTFLADCSSAVKFGKLPPGLFPNRPLRKMHELNDYMEEIVEPLKTIGESGVDIGKAILDTPGLGRLNLDEGESNQIYKCIQHLCKEIVARIGELDPLFQCKLMNAGSSFERVKIGYPNEFDFVCHMEKICAFVESVENVDIPEYCKILMKDSLPPDLSKLCLRSKKGLNAGAVLRHFCRLSRLATYDVLKRKHQHIYYGCLLLRESSDIFYDSPVPLGKLQGFTVSWRGPTYKYLDISIDINPVLYTTEWPSKATCSSILLPNIQEEGMYLIPKHCKQNFFSGVREIVTLDSDLWRYSTHHVEAIMMQRLPPEAKDSYMLCKAFRLEPLTCSIQVSNTEVEAAFEKQCPIDNQENAIQHINVENYGADSENEYDGENDDDDIHVEEFMCEMNNEFMTESENDDIKGDERRDLIDLDNGEKGGVLPIRDINISTDKYGGVVKVITRYEHLEDMYEITAEQCIPSYHLKSLFLQEAEAIISNSGTFSDLHLQTIPYKVYDRLKTAVESQNVSTLFFPGQNIYRQPQDDDILAVSIKLRISYINAILRLMRELGFASES